MLPRPGSIQDTSTPLPTLSTKGWVYSMADKADLLLSYYMVTQYSQTLLHHGYVKSLAYTVKNNTNDPFALAQTIKMDLEYIFKGYFDVAEVDVTYEQVGDTHAYNYTIYINIVHAGYKWDRTRKIKVADSKFEQIVNINNTGVAFI